MYRVECSRFKDYGIVFRVFGSVFRVSGPGVRKRSRCSGSESGLYPRHIDFCIT